MEEEVEGRANFSDCAMTGRERRGKNKIGLAKVLKKEREGVAVAEEEETDEAALFNIGKGRTAHRKKGVSENDEEAARQSFWLQALLYTTFSTCLSFPTLGNPWR